ncbi:MAG: hypothetical protein JNL13_11885 [Chitinophagaceae bacterium]|nr:hypothetical protein [Chitinophagaceae bacterium]
MKKTKLILALVFIVASFVLMQSSAPPPPGMSFDVDPRVETMGQTPPALKRVFVQKLLSTQSGFTMLLQLELDDSYSYEALVDTVDIYWGDSVSKKTTFFDDGTHGDNIMHDRIYSAYVVENVASFRADMIASENALINSGGFFNFIGHSGEWISTIPHFDAIAFDLGTRIELDKDLILHKMVSCDVIIREKSLFITDLAVVEDDARTYDFVHNTGNPTGAWTFGTLFKNMAGSVAPKDLLKSWVKHWTYDFTLNGQLVEQRSDVAELLLGPWIEKASGGTIAASTVTLANWELKWDDVAVPENKLLQYAPFKLTAIVNRMDLRQNTGYALPVSNSGETRFIFTLLQYDGKVPMALDPNLPASSSMTFPGFMDWEGLNVIFEYANVQSKRCDIKALAEMWVALGGYEFSNPAFRDHLQDITDFVTSENAAPSRINGSAIGRIRTNERIFYEPENKASIGFEMFRWGHADWEFRQFELDESSHLFKQVPLTNSPINFANYPDNLTDARYYVKKLVSYNGSVFGRLYDPAYPYGSGTYTVPQTLADWAKNSFVLKTLERGNHNMATTFHGQPLLAGSTIVVGEFSHYWDVIDPSGATALYSTDYPEMRHQLSLNTCEGCHNGETKTIFTQVRPLKQGEPARYWLPPLATPDHIEGYVDCPGNGFNPEGINSNSTLYPSMAGKRYYQNVSAFLTGTSYNGLSGSPNYDDDNSTDANDNNMDGLFYVNDPATRSTATTIKQHGFNDLLRRRDDLCSLINTDCNAFSIGNVVKAVAHTPLPLAGH